LTQRDPAPRTIVPIMDADPSAIADLSALPFPSKRKYVNSLRMVSPLHYLLSSPVTDRTDDRQEESQMTVKIERHTDGHHTTLRLIGHLHATHLEALQAQLESNGPRTVLDLDQVTLVDVEVVRFLGACEQAGTALLRCPPYIREWIAREQRQE
jgi:hypothetical protein